MDNQIETVQAMVNKVIEFFVAYSFQVLGALIILIAGFIIGKWVSNIVEKLCKKKNIDVTLSGFIASIAKLLVITFAIIIAMSKFGITIAPFIAMIGAVAFGATYALQGPLSNYGAGLSIILGRPFVVGDTINVAGVFGVVESVKLAHTDLITEDGVTITIPNKHIVGEIMHNSREFRIIEGIVGISYGDKPEKAINAIKDTISKIDGITANPPPQIGVENFGDSSVDIGYRYWVPTQKYFETMHTVNLAVFNSIKEAGITIPFPQREVLVTNNTEAY
jgi:small conductance mechanosensitive channel